MKIKIDKNIILLVLAVSGSYMFFYKPLKTRQEEAAINLEEKTTLLAQCLNAPEGLPSEDALITLKTDKENLLREYNLQSDQIFHKPINQDLLPRDEQKWPLYFRKILFQTTAEIRGYARAQKITLPAQFGFSTNLPEKEEVVNLLTRLGLVRQLIIISAQSGVDKILLLSPLIKKDTPEKKKPVQKKAKGDSKQEQGLEQISQEAEKQLESQTPEQSIKLSMLSNHPFIKEYPLLLKINSDTKTLYRLLYHLQKREQFYLIRNIQIRTDPQDRMRIITDLLISALLDKQKQQLQKTANKKEDNFFDKL